MKADFFSLSALLKAYYTVFINLSHFKGSSLLTSQNCSAYCLFQGTAEEDKNIPDRGIQQRGKKLQRQNTVTQKPGTEQHSCNII